MGSVAIHCVRVIDGKRDGGGADTAKGVCVCVHVCWREVLSQWGVKKSTTICHHRLGAWLSVLSACMLYQRTLGAWHSVCASVRNLNTYCFLRRNYMYECVCRCVYL